MTATYHPKTSVPSYPQIECGSCQQQLPLRLTNAGETAAVWMCAACNVPFVACCVESVLPQQAHLIRLHERSFDVTALPKISLTERQLAVKLASRRVSAASLNQRRSMRVAQSLVVSAVKLGREFVPIDEPFRLMVSNLSREGIGFVHDDRIDAEYVAIEFSPVNQSPIQVIVRLVRQRELTPPYYELGGEFFVRLGSVVNH